MTDEDSYQKPTESSFSGKLVSKQMTLKQVWQENQILEEFKLFSFNERRKCEKI